VRLGVRPNQSFLAAPTPADDHTGRMQIDAASSYLNAALKHVASLRRRATSIGGVTGPGCAHSGRWADLFGSYDVRRVGALRKRNETIGLIEGTCAQAVHTRSTPC
jgi:hypothetical protein